MNDVNLYLTSEEDVSLQLDMPTGGGPVITDPTLTLPGVPADAKATGDALANLKSDFNSQISDLGYAVVPIPWHISSSYKTGWNTGYHSGGIGGVISSTSSTNYIKCQYSLNATNFPELVEASYIEVIPPEDYCVRIIEVDAESSIITRMVGVINSSSNPEYKGVAQRIDVKSGHFYTLNLGRFNSNASTFLTTEFINSIQMRFWVKKKDHAFKPKLTNGSGNSPIQRQFFTVEVSRPLAFGGEDVNTTTEEVEAVIQLPETYRIEGDPVPLVALFHGASGYIQTSSDTWYNANWATFADALSSAGFALFDVNILPTSTGTESMGYCLGSPLAVNVAKAAYDYVVKNYNVQKKILVHGTSMGGVLASSFVRAYPQICLAQSSFAGRDFTQYLAQISPNRLSKPAQFAVAFGYTDMSDLISDKFSHAEGLAPSLTLKKFNSGVAALPPDREANFQGWLDYYAEIQSHSRADVVGDYTAYRSVPYKSWNSWSDNENFTKAEEILKKAYAAGGSAPYYCVIYETGTHTELSYGQINNMIPQLIAWYKHWLGA